MKVIELTMRSNGSRIVFVADKIASISEAFTSDGECRCVSTAGGGGEIFVTEPLHTILAMLRDDPPPPDARAAMLERVAEEARALISGGINGTAGAEKWSRLAHAIRFLDALDATPAKDAANAP